MGTVTSLNDSSIQPETTARKHSRLFHVKRGLLVLVILLVGLPIMGMIYESVMAAGDAERYPAPGQIVSVGDHKLHINCTGQGNPTVVLESGANGFSLDWYLAQPGIAEYTRVCSYDRAGYAWSESGPELHSPQQIALELHTLLANAGIEGPYVLVGQSNGGKYVRMFAIEFPQNVAGMVLVDGRHESLEPVRTPEQNEQDREAVKASFGLHRTLRRLGVARVFGAALVSSLNPVYAVYPADVRQMLAVIGVRENTLEVMDLEGHWANADDSVLSANSLPDGTPLLVLTASTSIDRDPRWLDAQKKLAALSDNSHMMIVDGADHMIQIDQSQVVVDGIREVVNAVRTGEPLAQ